jgi:hypothetical protein
MLLPSKLFESLEKYAELKQELLELPAPAVTASGEKKNRCWALLLQDGWELDYQSDMMNAPDSWEALMIADYKYV